MVIVSACWNKPVINSIVDIYFQRLEFRQNDRSFAKSYTEIEVSNKIKILFRRILNQNS